ncbi:hypothetical protein R3I94_021442 [Phoxinus phoxinus]
MSSPSNSRTTSVYGGAGGRGTRISSSSAPHSSSGRFNRGDAVDSPATGKASMQNLNNRLASYLEKVHLLETSNADLERKISDWNESRNDVTFDHSVFQDTINDLKNEIRSITEDNAAAILRVDNAKLAADDFKLKYDNELAMRRSIDADIDNLRKILDEFSLSRSELEMQIETLNEELIMLKKSHQEELSQVSDELGAQGNVSSDVPAPSMDLARDIDEIRKKYENMAEKNRQEMVTWSESKINTVQREVVTHNEELQSSITELKELTSSFQRLKIELQTLLSTKSALAEELKGTHDRYGDQLARLQTAVTDKEDLLSQFHAKIANNKQEYDALLDVKSILERDIEQFRNLMRDVESEPQPQKVTTKPIAVVETVVNETVVKNSKPDVDEKK